VPPASPVSPAITARIVHAGLVLGLLLFLTIAWLVATRISLPISAIPDRRVLYLGLFVVSAVLFGAAMYTAGRLTPPVPGSTQDDWWKMNLGRALIVWALIDAPAFLGMVAYLLTHDFRTLIAPFTGLLLFVNYRPSRLWEG
jgi:hypothetical protein